MGFKELSYQSLTLVPQDLEKGPLFPIELLEFIQGMGAEPKKRRSFGVTTYIYQSGLGVLHNNVRVESALGWGDLDLSSLIRASSGSFQILIDPDLPGNQVRQLKALFVPEHGPQACTVVLDVTPQFLRQWRNGGFSVRLQDRSYLESIGGQFVLFFFSEDRVHLAGLRIYDSRSSASTCHQMLK